jgi:hypothetical protein
MCIIIKFKKISFLALFYFIINSYCMEENLCRYQLSQNEEIINQYITYFKTNLEKANKRESQFKYPYPDEFRYLNMFVNTLVYPDGNEHSYSKEQLKILAQVFSNLMFKNPNIFSFSSKKNVEQQELEKQLNESIKRAFMPKYNSSSNETFSCGQTLNKTRNNNSQTQNSQTQNSQITVVSNVIRPNLLFNFKDCNIYNFKERPHFKKFIYSQIQYHNQLVKEGQYIRNESPYRISPYNSSLSLCLFESLINNRNKLVPPYDNEAENFEQYKRFTEVFFPGRFYEFEKVFQEAILKLFNVNSKTVLNSWNL